MPAPKQLLVVAAMLEGCGYYACKDSVKQRYVPEDKTTWETLGVVVKWQDPQTLTVYFGAELSPPDQVDPRRFALLRYTVDIGGRDYYQCFFDICDETLEGDASIPDSLEWDPAQASVLLLHFTEPIPSSACDHRRGERADFQALELIYRGTHHEPGDETGGLVVEPDMLVYADDEPVEAIGPETARDWLEQCDVGEPCELAHSCRTGGGYGSYLDRNRRGLWVDCP